MPVRQDDVADAVEAYLQDFRVGGCGVRQISRVEQQSNIVRLDDRAEAPFATAFDGELSAEKPDSHVVERAAECQSWLGRSGHRCDRQHRCSNRREPWVRHLWTSRAVDDTPEIARSADHRSLGGGGQPSDPKRPGNFAGWML